MSFFRSIALSIYRKPSLYLFIFLIIFSFDRYNRWVNYNNSKFPLVDDVDQFYSYLPAVFIKKDLSFNFPNNYWTVPGKNDNRIPRPTYGMAIMYSPFFFIGHIIAKNFNYTTDGYSLPYKWCLHFGTFLYAFCGLWYTRKNLLKFFKEAIVFLTLIVVFLGTNLFYYVFGWGEMCHSYLFCIISLFIYSTLRWFETQKLRYLFVLSFLAGFATLIRPTDVVILLFPLLYNVQNFQEFKNRLKSFVKLRFKILLAFLVFAVPVFLQLIYWKIFSGSWVVHTYGDKEGFFFNDPQIINFLFSYRKGWFIYTPVMAFILVGIPFLVRTAKQWFWFLIIFFWIDIYLLSSWWDWGFGGSFGCRAIIQHYAFFTFGLASFTSMAFNLALNRKILNMTLKTLLCILFGYLITLNYNQSWKYKYELIHYNGMTKEAYWFVFNKKNLSPSQWEEFNKLIKPPDFNKMLDGSNRNQ